MKVLIVVNGRINSLSFLEREIGTSDYIICTDGAASYLKAINQVPDLLVGDLDSIAPGDLAWMQQRMKNIDTYPRRKDQTDSELAVDKALALQPTKITLIGAVGSRLDHSLGNMMLLYKILAKGVTGRLVDENNEMLAVNSTIEIEGEIGQTVSLVPISEEVKGVSLEGFEYPLERATITRGSTLGISNVLSANRARIEMQAGSMFVIKTREE